MTEMYIDIAQKFSDSPSGRYIEDGEYCGANFLHQYLLPNIHRSIFCLRKAEDCPGNIQAG